MSDFVGHAVSPIQSTQSSEMEPHRGPVRLLEDSTPPANRGAKMFTTDDAGTAVHTTVHDEKKKLDKKSMDYLVRSGIAGGLAGCAVSRGHAFSNG